MLLESVCILLKYVHAFCAVWGYVVSLLVFHKFLEPVMCFTLKTGSDLHSGSIGPSRTVTYLVERADYCFLKGPACLLYAQWSEAQCQPCFPRVHWSVHMVCDSYLRSFAIVGLRLTKTTCVTPVTRVALRCRSNLGAWTWPEPTVHVRRLQVRPVASIEVALAPGRPDVAHVACNC